jgi:hypothetical protein
MKLNAQYGTLGPAGPAGIKAFLTVFFTVFGRPAAPFRDCGAPGGLPALRGVLGLPELPEHSNQQQPMKGPEKGISASAQAGGGRFFSKNASLAALSDSNNRLEPVRRP